MLRWIYLIALIIAGVPCIVLCLFFWFDLHSSGHVRRVLCNRWFDLDFNLLLNAFTFLDRTSQNFPPTLWEYSSLFPFLSTECWQRQVHRSGILGCSRKLEVGLSASAGVTTRTSAPTHPVDDSPILNPIGTTAHAAPTFGEASAAKHLVPLWARYCYLGNCYCESLGRRGENKWCRKPALQI